MEGNNDDHLMKSLDELIKDDKANFRSRMQSKKNSKN